MPNLKKRKRLILQVPLLIFSSFFHLCKIAKKEKIGVIHAHFIFSNGFVAACYKRFLNPAVKLICTAHGSDLLVLK